MAGEETPPERTASLRLMPTSIATAAGPSQTISLPEVLTRARQAAMATTGDVLPAHRPKEEVAKLATSSQTERAKENNISPAQQKKLDALARRAPALLEEVRAGTKSTHRACIEAGIVKVPA